MIYTLDYLQQEAEQIAGAWNGKTEQGEEQAQAANELLEKLAEIKELVAELGI